MGNWAAKSLHMAVISRWLLTAALVACQLATAYGADERYIAWFNDGTKLTAGNLPQWPVPGSPSRFENRDLTSPTNPLRLIRDRRANVSRKPPLLVLANGD